MGGNTCVPPHAVFIYDSEYDHAWLLPEIFHRLFGFLERSHKRLDHRCSDDPVQPAGHRLCMVGDRCNGGAQGTRAAAGSYLPCGSARADLGGGKPTLQRGNQGVTDE